MFCSYSPCEPMGTASSFPYVSASINLHYPVDGSTSPSPSPSAGSWGPSSLRQFCSTVGCGDLRCLSLSMSPSQHSGCISSLQQHATNYSSAATGCLGLETKKRGYKKSDNNAKLTGYQKQVVHRKSIDTFGQRTSQYRGVTRLRLVCFPFLLQSGFRGV